MPHATSQTHTDRAGLTMPSPSTRGCTLITFGYTFGGRFYHPHSSTRPYTTIRTLACHRRILAPVLARPKQTYKWFPRINVKIHQTGKATLSETGVLLCHNAVNQLFNPLCSEIKNAGARSLAGEEKLGLKRANVCPSKSSKYKKTLQQPQRLLQVALYHVQYRLHFFLIPGSRLGLPQK